jgi:hypothetical protein
MSFPFYHGAYSRVYRIGEDPLRLVKEAALPKLLRGEALAAPPEDLVPQKPQLLFQYFGAAGEIGVVFA